MRLLVRSQFVAVSVVALLLSACGGGGGGDSPPPVSNPPPGTPPPPTNPGAPTYTGSTQPVPLNRARTPHVVAAVIAELSLTSVSSRPYPTKVSNGVWERPYVRELAKRAARAFALVEEPCPGGGTVDITDNTNDSGVGTVIIVLRNCVTDGVVENGTIRVRVDTVVQQPPEFVPTDLTTTFERYTASSGALSVLIDGTQRIQLVGQTVTETFNVFGEYQPENVQVRLADVRIVTAPNNQPPFGLRTTASGRLYHSNHGFVDISTDEHIIAASFEGAVPSAGLLRITGAQASTATISFIDGFHTVRLDSDGNSLIDATLTATWNGLRDTQNFLPTPRLGPDATIVEGASITLDASASSDWEGDPFTFEWNVFNRPPGSTAAIASSSATAVFTPDVPGIYDISVVTRQNGNGTSDVLRLTVNANADPTVNAGPDVPGVLERESVPLTGTFSDPENDPVTFRWEIVQRPMGSTQTPIFSTSATANFIPDAPGVFVLQFSADDQRGVGTDTLMVTAEKYLTVTNINASFLIRVDSPVSSTRGTLLLQTNPMATGIPVGYTVQSTEPWLVVPPGGTAPTAGNSATIELELDIDELDLLTNGNHIAFVTVVPDGGRDMTMLTVPLDFRLPVLTNVTPHVAYTGFDTSVNLFGTEMFQADGRTLRIGGTTVAGTIVRTSNTHARSVVPATLPAGVYTVSVDNTLGIEREMARVVVRDAPAAYTDAQISLPGRVEALEYDIERDQFYAIFATSPEFTARVIRRVSGVWNADQVIGMPVPPRGLTVTPDGRFLLVTGTNCAVYRFDLVPQTFNAPISESHCFPGTDAYEDIMALGDGHVVLSSSNGFGGLVDLSTFAPATPLPPLQNPVPVLSEHRNIIIWATSLPRSIYHHDVGFNSPVPAQFDGLAVGDFDMPRPALTVSRNGRYTLQRANVHNGISLIGEMVGLTDRARVVSGIYGVNDDLVVALDELAGSLRRYDISFVGSFSPIPPAIPLAGEALVGSRVFIPPTDQAAFVFTTREADPNVPEMWVRVLPP